MTIKKILDVVRRLHKDERGEVPIGPLLLIGLIAIPIVIALVTFGNEILKWLSEEWVKLKGTKVQDPGFGNG